MLLLEKNNIEQELRDLLCELEYRKRVNPISFYNHLPLQQKFHNDESKVKGICGGNRAGKTEEGSEYVISKCLAKPKQRWWASAETFQDSVNIQQRKVWDLVPKNRLKYGRYDEINGFTNRKLLFDNGSMILFKSYDQGRESFASDDVDGIWNDEEPPYDIYKEQRMRLIDRNGEMIFTMTSLKGITDLIQDLFEDHDVIESAFAPLVKKELPRIVNKNGMRFYMLWTPENPHIDQKRVLEEVKLMPTDEIMARIYGLPINLSGKIYMAFNKGVHVIPFENLPDLKDCTLYHILDPHDRKPWAMIWVAVHKTGTCYVIDEYPNRNFNEMLYDDKTYDDYAALIRDKEDALLACGCNRIYKRILDPNFGNKTVQLAERQGGQSKTTPKEELKKRGLKFIDGIDSIEAGHLKVREFLHYEKKDGEIVVQPKIFFTDNCENAIRHHSRYSRKDILDNSGDVKNKVNPQEKYKDFCDLTRYFTMSNPRHESESPMPKTAPTADRIY
jgi:phage terminase large subunit-like protein